MSRRLYNQNRVLLGKDWGVGLDIICTQEKSKIQTMSSLSFDRVYRTVLKGEERRRRDSKKCVVRHGRSHTGAMNKHPTEGYTKKESVI